jgi:hypothetical protein
MLNAESNSFIIHHSAFPRYAAAFGAACTVAVIAPLLLVPKKRLKTAHAPAASSAWILYITAGVPAGIVVSVNSFRPSRRALPTRQRACTPRAPRPDRPI